MQNNKEKIAKILTDELSYCYCDNCEFGNWDKCQDTRCDDCHRKYQNWRLSQNTAEEIADKIIKLGEIYPISKEELEGAIKNAE